MILGLIAWAAVAQGAGDLLPDIILWREQTENSWYIGTTGAGEPPSGRRCIRFSATTANLGTGPVDLRGGTSYFDTDRGVTLQHVNQRVYQRSGSGYTFYDRLAGNFTYHPSHGHIHFDNWTFWQLRRINPDGSSGDVVGTGSKMSFCIIETTVYNSSLPGFNETQWGSYGCGQIQGTRPGRADTYGAGLDGQYVDITGVPDGTYYLEGTVNIAHGVLESDYSNNTIRFPVTIGSVPAAQPDRYEANDSIAQVNALPEGGLNSANLGLVNAYKFIDNLSMTTENVDYFKFRLNKTATNGNYLQISSGYPTGQALNLYLLDANGNQLAAVTDGYQLKQISLAGRTAGWYFAKITRQSGQNPRYMLEINPAADLPPTVTFTSPSGNVYVEKANETVPVTWTCSDPEGDPKTLMLLYDTQPVVASSNVQITGYENLRGSDLQANVNTASIPVGTFWLIGRAWDGGAFSYSFSPGQFTVYVKGDITMDGQVNSADWALYKNTYPNIPASWTPMLDMNRDGVVDRGDIKMFNAACFGG